MGQDPIERYKPAVRRFNPEVIGGESRGAFDALMRDDFTNLPAPAPNVSIQVIDIVRLQDHRYAEHRRLNTFEKVLAELKAG